MEIKAPFDAVSTRTISAVRVLAGRFVHDFGESAAKTALQGQPGKNALKLAFQESFGVVSFPFAVQHLVDAEFLQYIEQQMSYGAVEVTALYRITEKGQALAERWLGEEE